MVTQKTTNMKWSYLKGHKICDVETEFETGWWRQTACFALSCFMLEIYIIFLAEIQMRRDIPVKNCREFSATLNSELLHTTIMDYRKEKRINDCRDWKLEMRTGRWHCAECVSEMCFFSVWNYIEYIRVLKLVHYLGPRVIFPLDTRVTETLMTLF